MKRVLSLILVAVMLLGTLTSCANIMSFFGNDEGLEKAQANVKQLYINRAKVTNADFEVVPQVTIGQDVYTIEWTVNVTDGVKVEKTEDGKVWIRVNSKTEVEIPYVLTATIKSPKGKTITQTFEFSVPKFKELTWAEFAATEDDEPVVIKGVIGGIVETAKENDLYLQDENGGYFVYKLAVKPSEQGLKVGMTVRVSGIRDTYYGVYQISNPQVEILDATIKEVAPIDITQAFVDAKDLKSESLTKYQSMFVTIKGATVLGQDADNPTYFNFSLAGKKAYVRISSSTSMLTPAGDATFKKNVADHIGYSADITGFVSIYSNNIYIIPLNENAFSNFVVADRTPAEQVAFEKELLKDKVNTTITEAGTIDLVTAPQLYKDVTISWSVSENEYAKVENGKLVVSLPDEEVKVTLTATLTQGEASDTASYEVTIAAAPTIIPQIVTAPAANTGYKYFLKQNKIGQTLYFAGLMENTYYLGTTTNPTEAVDVGFEPVEGKDGEYYLYFMDGTIKTYIVAYVGTKTDGSEVANLKLSIHQKEANVWTFNAEHNTPTTKLTIKNENGEPKEDTYYIGAYNEFQTFSLSKISYASNSTSFVARFATLIDVSAESDASKVATEKEALTIATEYKRAGEFELPIFGSTFAQVEISWASNSEFAVVEGDTLKVTQQKDDQTVILTATITFGDVTETKEFTITIFKPVGEPAADSTITIEQAIAIGESKAHNVYTEGKYYVTGVITEVYNTQYGNMKIKDDAGNILTVYGTWSEDGNTRYDALEVKPVAGETITVYGIVGQYNGTPQVKNGWIVGKPSVEPEETTPSTPTDPDQPLTYEDYIAAQDGEALSKLVNVVVTGIVSKSAGSSYNCLFVQDANGGAYYIYGMTQDPIADLKIEIGMTVSIEGGVKAIHYGTHEIKPSENGMTVTVVSSEKTPVAPVDYTEIFKNATDMKDEALVGKQALLVTIKGIVIGGQNTGSGYLYFKIGDKEAYLRISSSTLGFNTADKDAFIAAHAAKKGYSADVTGIISQYNGAFYLVPVSTDAFVYGELVEQPEETTPAPETPDEPAADSTLTIVGAVTLGDSMAHNTTTTGKYYVTGVVQEIKHTTYGNMYIVDENGNSIYVYGTYSADGSARYDAMDVKPVAGDTVTLYGVVGNYNGAQIKNAWITAHTAAAPSTPNTPSTPETGASTTISFADKGNRTEFTSEIQVWEQNGITVTNNKGGSTNAVADYANPARFYKNSELIIAYPGMTKIVIACNNASYATSCQKSLSAAGANAVADGQNVTITFAEAVDSFTFTLSDGQVRVDSITVYTQN